ncbi:MAG: serine/threonine-protein kinase [Steroidobacteraceae bacterium]
MSRTGPSLEDIVTRARSMSTLERASFVREACGSDETLISQVFLALDEEDFGSDGTAPSFENDLANERVGAYRLLRRLGSGGMGDVYLAERADDEYRQQVAIKLVRTGLMSAQVQARLRMERQILASLQHPNIARLLDGGRASDGRPYIVMEFIEGESIDVYCDRHKLSIEARLELIRTVCLAVQYAHQNLVVHRDLKPNNILVTADGTVKLLDFGIAKLLDARHSPQTLAVTHVDYRMLTPAHASPEQIRGDLITTSSDIYVLGGLMYELLCGRRPYDLVGVRLSELERIVCNNEPALLSVRAARTFAESPELAADIATCRDTTAPRLIKRLRGDLDNIVLKSMRREPARRYGSCEQLASDITAHLDGRPALAAPDHWTYRTGKFVRRNALAVAFAATAIVLLTSFAVVTAIQAQRIALERDVAASERSRAEQVSSFLVEMFKLSDPNHSRGNEVTARELLDIGARRVTIGLANQPRTRAVLLGTIGEVYSSLGLFGEAIRLLEAELATRIKLHGEHHLDVAKTRAELGQALTEINLFERAEKELSTALAVQTALAGTSALEAASTLRYLGNLARTRSAFLQAGQYYARSLAIYQSHGTQDMELAELLNDTAILHAFRGEHAEAERLYDMAFDIAERQLGRDHPQTAMYSFNVAISLQDQGKLDQAGPLYQHALEVYERIMGKDHPASLDMRANYGRYLHLRGDYGAAEQVLRDVLEADRRTRGTQHAYLGHDYVSLGLVLLDRGEFETAEQQFRAALDIYARTLPADHAFVVSALTGLGRSLSAQGDAQAVQVLERAELMGRRVLPRDGAQLAAARSELAIALLANNRREEAARLLEQSYPILAREAVANPRALERARTAREQLQREPARGPSRDGS